MSVTSTNTYSGSYSYIGTRFTITAFNKTTLQRSETSATFVSDQAMTAPTITATFKTATSVGLYVNHQNWFNYGAHIFIDYKKVTETDWTPVDRMSSSASVSPVYIDDLEPDTTYQFRAGFIGFQNVVPSPTILSLTTAASEFKKVFFSSGDTTGFVAALALKGAVKFYHSLAGTAFTLLSQIAIEKPCFYFNDTTNLCLVGGYGKLFYSTDFKNWTEVKVAGTIRDIQYDQASGQYLFFNETSRLFTINETELRRLTILGPFVPTTCEDFSRFVVSDLSEFAFALGPTTTFTSF